MKTYTEDHKELSTSCQDDPEPGNTDGRRTRLLGTTTSPRVSSVQTVLGVDNERRKEDDQQDTGHDDRKDHRAMVAHSNVMSMPLTSDEGDSNSQIEMQPYKLLLRAFQRPVAVQRNLAPAHHCGAAFHLLRPLRTSALRPHRARRLSIAPQRPESPQLDHLWSQARPTQQHDTQNGISSHPLRPSLRHAGARGARSMRRRHPLSSHRCTLSRTAGRMGWILPNACQTASQSL